MAKKTLYEVTYWAPNYTSSFLIRAQTLAAAVDSIQPGELTYWLNENLAEVKRRLVEYGAYVDMAHTTGARIAEPIIREV